MEIAASCVAMVCISPHDQFSLFGIPFGLVQGTGDDICLQHKRLQFRYSGIIIPTSNTLMREEKVEAVQRKSCYYKIFGHFWNYLPCIVIYIEVHLVFSMIHLVLLLYL
jgi:hypothetical protein